MKPTVFITKKIPKEVEEYISEYCNYEIWNKPHPISRKELLEKLENLDGIMTTKESIDKEFFSYAKNIKIISNIAVGYDNFDIELMKDNNVKGTHTPHVLDETVADTAFGLLIMTSRKLSYLDRYVKKGEWKIKEHESFLGKDIHNATLGIIGSGRIGEKLIRRAVLGFNMEVIYHNRSRNKEIENKYNAKYTTKEKLLQEADFIMTLLPLNKETNNYISYKEFELMKKDSFFINISRGKVVDELALIDALNREEIAGAGLDVYEKEPISIDSPLLNMDNVVTLPHVGSASKKTRNDMAMKAAQNLVAGVYGEEPEDLIKEMNS